MVDVYEETHTFIIAENSDKLSIEQCTYFYMLFIYMYQYL